MIDVEVRKPRLWTEIGDIAGGAVLETRAYGEDRVGLAHEQIRALPPCMPNMPISSGSPAARVPSAWSVVTAGASSRCASFAGQLGRTGGDHTAADVEQRALRAGKQLRQRLELRLRARRRALAAARFRPRGDVGARRKHILRDVDGHRSRPAGLGESEGQRHGFKELVERAHEEVVLGDRQSQPVGSTSWNASVPISGCATWPVIATSGTESRGARRRWR
jgi:hypothetical protein